MLGRRRAALRMWERAFSVADWLQARPELARICAEASERLRGSDGRVLGFDAVDDARRALLAGTMEATVAQFPDEMGRLAVETAVKVLKGESVPPDIVVRIGLVTRENANR